ncbi:hypothetical protein [Methanococcus maripaludis]|uniref:Uncharacterized protein n=1 Tax=Methanococcus maripaludis TaxID=39152 RepID=A0A2L1C9N4_METMI|nr:hypothetical protein [Methanococcus maripaludis]AVB76092.1 hypothetical protein MMJJ_06780 [Methanococcus maripaludis]
MRFELVKKVIWNIKKFGKTYRSCYLANVCRNDRQRILSEASDEELSQYVIDLKMVAPMLKRECVKRNVPFNVSVLESD